MLRSFRGSSIVIRCPGFAGLQMGAGDKRVRRIDRPRLGGLIDRTNAVVEDNGRNFAGAGAPHRSGQHHDGNRQEDE